jgi:hypothetical protein
VASSAPLSPAQAPSTSCGASSGQCAARLVAHRRAASACEPVSTPASAPRGLALAWGAPGACRAAGPHTTRATWDGGAVLTLDTRRCAPPLRSVHACTRACSNCRGNGPAFPVGM